MVKTLPKLEKLFKNNELFTLALTHRSYLNEHSEVKESNERVEFLGDAILSFIVSRYLYLKYPDKPEGQLTLFRTKLVQTATLGKLAKELLIGDQLYLSKGEETNGGRSNVALLANSYEAVLGALLLDQGLEACERFVTETLLSRAEELLEESPVDAKSELQEKVQAGGLPSPLYETVAAQGPDHAKIFTVVVKVEGKVLGEGKGRSKQEAEQKAAAAGLSGTN
ncbi:MAG: Ribonuclease 3 [Microgenomates group bacterium GW2011_GWA2_44_7]|uniref:Ribonuclease 3 n=1 Tax=Candidatus Woesebacteria bacterium GW2011_GWA1_43_12 TaxID=1618557 RepID=A0A0G1CY76_9BACT|nr:MAG: Ribonuclease 3 [Candidatus Woesebacteria bacterium GW2011_GWA1_43_12]KKT76257.1 MAG: Ribonuclease 3 [Microgenomates group bacterium GW2011_GWA2_44_7]KKT77731.1 MAG: Ribonuclease 3 [Microgenomates group bacterium GW2011_GWB1_44_8]